MMSWWIPDFCLWTVVSPSLRCWELLLQRPVILSVLTPDNVSGYKDAADAEAETEESADSEPEAASAPDIKVDGAVTTIRGGKVVISIKEGKDIYLELPI